jgi:uncharacterized protein DUF4190
MIMKNQSDNPVRKTNRLAIVSLVTGILSLLPYFPILIFLYTGDCLSMDYEKNSLCGMVDSVTRAIPGIVYLLGGIIFGIVSLIASKKALGQISSGDQVEKGRSMAITGIILGIFGIIVNIYYFPGILYGFIGGQ